MVLLREFLYRRDDLVAQFLEQIEGGEYDEERLREHGGRATGASASAGIGPVTLSGERRKDGSSEKELTMRQTAASRFNRLHFLLTASDAIQPLNSLDDAIWNQLVRNEVIEVEASLSQSVAGCSGDEPVRGHRGDAATHRRSEHASRRVPTRFRRPKRRRAGTRPDLRLPRCRSAARRWPSSCTFAPIGAPRYTFFAELSRESIREELADLEGEVTILARLTRKIEKGKPETQGQPVPGMQLSRKQRRKGGQSQSLTIRLQYPAAVVSVVGIYR